MKLERSQDLQATSIFYWNLRIFEKNQNKILKVYNSLLSIFFQRSTIFFIITELCFDVDILGPSFTRVFITRVQTLILTNLIIIPFNKIISKKSKIQLMKYSCLNKNNKALLIVFFFSLFESLCQMKFFKAKV